LLATRGRVALVTTDPAALDQYVRALELFCDVETVASATATIELVLVDRSVELVICTSETLDLTAYQFLQSLGWMMPDHPPVVVLGASSRDEKTRAAELGATASFPARCSARVLSSGIARLLDAGRR
jgi:DNA-binding NtrC family response regulator